MPHKGEDAKLTDRDRMIHIRLAAQDAITFVKGRNRSDLDAEPMLRRALINCIQEIGEAAACYA